ncbi:PfkB family carbohydrate kinase [Actinokineospora auranticolor]|uniref:Ribokinase n=1 Tax=Actinokineospora auranticolor TaxID=155976 RepID=A0A2S6GN97_9PSEU|nr:PfkB family carbohydrate kinase [Actinokineospora auranticolor]PPK66643.1 ribokinase [Actinokineospora auranticolor]
MENIAVVGQVARDLVLLVPHLPEEGSSVPVRERRELPGGQGFGVASAAGRLGARATLVGVVGGDTVGDWLVEKARSDGIRVDHVVRREDSLSALVVNVVDDDERWRCLEDVPDGTLVTPGDVSAAGDALSRADAVVVQLRQPAETALAAAGCANGLVVLDGAPSGYRDRILAAADVVRLNRHDAESLGGRTVDSVAAAARVAGEVLARGPRLVAVTAPEATVFAHPDGAVVAPLHGDESEFLAALTLTTLRGLPVEEAAHVAVRAGARAA